MNEQNMTMAKMNKPKLLDLFCGAGGASKGLDQAGFDVTGIDILPQPNYPFKFIQIDAIDAKLINYDAFWASPPCQTYSWAAKRWNKHFDDYISTIREMLNFTKKPYIIENVVGAPLRTPILLCGTMFELNVIRHRLFESRITLIAPYHPKHRGLIKQGYYMTVAGHGGDGRAFKSLWKRAMNIDWMSKKELTQAIPPAYAHCLGLQLINHV